MTPMINIPPKGNQKRVVIIGGGFAGLKAAQELNSKMFQIILIDRNNYHTFQPMLYQVATAGVEASSISFPFRKIFRKKKNCHVRMCEALRVIPEKNILETSIGEVEYDYLIIASGTKTNYFGNDELAKTTMSLKNTDDALYNRNKILKSLEDAQNSSNEEIKSQLTTFAIVGGGPTGVELAGALGEMKKYLLHEDYPDMDINNIKIILLDGGKRLLATFSEKSSEKVYKALTERGVEICLDTKVKEYKDNTLFYNENSTLKTRNVYWVAGVIANNIEGFPKECYGHGNRLNVNAYNQAQGYNNIFAIGDAALMITEKYPKGHPQVAQPAIQQGKHVAINIEYLEHDLPMTPFRYFDKGNMATIGRNNAIVEMKYLRFGGFLGWISWLFIHLMYTIGVKNKIDILLDWIWAYFRYDPSLRLILSAKNTLPKEEANSETADKQKSLA